MIMCTTLFRNREAYGFLCFILLFGSSTTFAGELRLKSETSPTWTPDLVANSPVFSVGVAENPFEGTVGSVLTWQLELTIEGASGSNGNVLFSGVSLPPVSERLFGVNSQGLTPSSLAAPLSHIVTIGDADASFVGVSVPSTGKQILELTFQASEDAEGVFEIYAHALSAPSDGSYWYSGAFDLLSFEDLSIGEENLLLGSITIERSSASSSASVPENSSSASLIGVFAVFHILNCFQLRYRSRQTFLV